MTTDRAKQILTCYGGCYEQWPVAERLALKNLLLTDEALQAEQQQALILDEQLEQLFAVDKEVNTQQLEQNILLNLPDRVLKRTKLADRLLPFHDLFYFAKTLGAVALILFVTVSLIQFKEKHQIPARILNSQGDELFLMAEALDDSDEQEWLALIDTEFFEDDLNEM